MTKMRKTYGVRVHCHYLPVRVYVLGLWKRPPAKEMATGSERMRKVAVA